ncbi:electron transport complex protein [Pectobacterium atrosepticum SCRI1043]|uniref:Ion-translocating oxidoreductase complex subunit C n=1 Tax=Pectobacterium atrosepticum (strain SCRI 1043 / ATCC BAA-672) TaxID=218491 RepID=RNFC_PECAS|nr:electron transport complex subunit RsxC [Pectobacterium atrosepticum]Q6D4W2.1 RecName: Full=Ion-translocating oxidoreductase complex subunit C; AltName: Full=Rnf electron transport complex subunit C [Pectobacterium atrosepticum SCRI1043]GKV85375.1 electron transport complex subunit C [Pectobacterium carotovorum subsp. carotovorum]AIA71089.1 electron transporter RnfC [Pectobacterium atrosepticum]ATY90906.1 electron transport complex subunit RsxC [Pectobacterium atrosepticum]KFX14127.1 electr
MLKLFSAFRKDRIWDFDGGIHPPEMKTQSSQTPLRQISLPEQFIIPLKQHLGPEGEICVSVGDKVLRGQPLTRGKGRTLPVHAPTSGTVNAIRQHTTAHPSGLSELSIIIVPDGEDRWCERLTYRDYRAQSVDTLLAHLHQAGIAGLGGAGFPTAAKLQGGMRGIETLIINGAECEPYITADDRLMQECADEIIQGVEILSFLLQPKRILIGIEDNKPEAISALRLALGKRSDMQLRVIPTKYPSGGAKQLTKILTGKEVPFGKHSAAIGVLMQNVGTAYAIKRAVIDGEPLTERVVTLTGEALRQPGNVWARLGTPVRHLLKQGGFHVTKQPMVVMGGPLMGFTLPLLDVPIVKISNCLLAPSHSEMEPVAEEQSCIRCSKCADACPAGLLPQQLYWFSRGQEHEKARDHHLFDCIECGACAYVCPSNIPLVQYYRQEKAEIRAIDEDAQRAALAKVRFDAKQARLEREKAARELRHKQAAAGVSTSDKDAVQAALERVRRKQTAEAEIGSPITVIPDAQPDNSAAIAARAAHKALVREERVREKQSQQETPATEVTPEELDPRKAAVAAALARVKARKAAQQSELNTTESVSSAIPDTAAEPIAVVEAQEQEDPRKAAVAAAIARVKARKAAQQLVTNVEAAVPVVTETTAEPIAVVEVQEPEDPRKAAVAAAIARVKARKAAQASSYQEE